jgi:hypothetical protein
VGTGHCGWGDLRYDVSIVIARTARSGGPFFLIQTFASYSPARFD